MRNTAIALAFIGALAILATAAFGHDDHEGHEHTHIGRNQDQVPSGDDNKLWIFSMPDEDEFPNWGTLELELWEGVGSLAGKYVCDHVYCWHSAHPEHGNWQLGGADSGTTPDWLIAIERVSFDPGFAMVDFDTFAPILTSDGATYTMPKFFFDEHNELGGDGAWGFEKHLYFVADAAGPGETFSATFKALDLGSTGFADSDEFTINFVTVPEPVSLAWLGLGGLALMRRHGR